MRWLLPLMMGLLGAHGESPIIGQSPIIVLMLPGNMSGVAAPTAAATTAAPTAAHDSAGTGGGSAIPITLVIELKEGAGTSGGAQPQPAVNAWPPSFPPQAHHPAPAPAPAPAAAPTYGGASETPAPPPPPPPVTPAPPPEPIDEGYGGEPAPPTPPPPPPYRVALKRVRVPCRDTYAGDGKFAGDVLCRFWAGPAEAQCEANKDWMSRNCAASCGLNTCTALRRVRVKMN